MPDDVTALSRRSLMMAGGATLVGIGSAAAQGGAGQGTPGPQRPVDTGKVENGKVTFPNWRGPSDRPSAPPPAPLPPAERVGFAVVGLGRLSLEEILPAFGACRKAKPVALMSGSPEKAKAVAAQHGIRPEAVYGYDGWDALARNPEVKAVYIVTPNAVHRDQVIAAAGAGKHVLCEKPMAVSSAEARAMIDACAKAKVKLMIAYRCQYEPYNREVVRLARSEKYGKVKLIEATNTQTMSLPEQWRMKKALAGGGALPDIGLYCLNGVRALTGEEPVSVQAQIHSPDDDPLYREVEETVAFTLRFPSGALALCSTSYGAHETRSLTVQAEGGAIQLQNAFAYQGQRLFLSHREGKAEAKEERVLGEKNQFALEIDHMATCILEDRTPRTPGEEGLQDQILMEAIYEAARTGRSVALKEPERSVAKDEKDRGGTARDGKPLDRTRGPEPEDAG
ncbi:Gfo/Idh/MocA family protein [Methylobacterium platani]|uniref:Oxidoreductase n=2 Tax=Methylobacterium platani TaxID=427683 RepID=A0A179SG33_9HYPH|nr:Gfo/Idh/MocA family oxidoreductase [Methylobacterium platani]KMO14124.1 oxidoreductase [Methylobacterium platani JCM 14648]OAS26837.1 oxidoreductase [Methylobacterium platani]